MPRKIVDIIMSRKSMALVGLVTKRRNVRGMPFVGKFYPDRSKGKPTMSYSEHVK